MVPSAFISRVCSAITVIVAAITCVQSFRIKWQEDKIKLQQEAITLQQQTVKLKQDEISEQLKQQSSFVADISKFKDQPATFPLILSLYKDKNAALQAAMGYPEHGYELAQNLVASATDRKTAKEMGVIPQANGILAQLSDQIHLQREESYARHEEFTKIVAYAAVQVLGGVGHDLLSLRNLNLAPSLLNELMISLKDGDLAKLDPSVLNDLVREKLKKAGDRPVFTRGVLKQLVSRGKRLLEQSTSPIYEEIVDREFIDRMKRVEKQVEDVTRNLDDAKPEELNGLALRLNDLYDDLAPTISQTKKESENVIRAFEEFISLARPALDSLDRGALVPPRRVEGTRACLRRCHPRGHHPERQAGRLLQVQSRFSSLT